jgi:hypothetical protein
MHLAAMEVVGRGCLNIQSPPSQTYVVIARRITEERAGKLRGTTDEPLGCYALIDSFEEYAVLHPSVSLLESPSGLLQPGALTNV